MFVGCRSTFAIIGVSGETHFRELLGISFLVLVSLFFWKCMEAPNGRVVRTLWGQPSSSFDRWKLAQECWYDLPMIAQLSGIKLVLEHSHPSFLAHVPFAATASFSWHCLSWLMWLGCVDCTWPHFPTSQDALRIPGGKYEAYENKLDADPVPPGMHTDLTNHLSFTHFCSLSRCSSNLMTSTSFLVVNNPQTSFRNGCKHINAELHLTSHQHTSWRLLMEPFLH